MAFTRRTGVREVVSCLAGSALAKGDLVQSIEATGSTTVDNAASNSAVFGVTLEAIASGSVGLVDRIHPGDIFEVTGITGTMSAAGVFKLADIVDETTVTLTASNNDVRVMGWDGATTNKCYVSFTSPELSTATITI